MDNIIGLFSAVVLFNFSYCDSAVDKVFRSWDREGSLILKVDGTIFPLFVFDFTYFSTSSKADNCRFILLNCLSFASILCKYNLLCSLMSTTTVASRYL